MPPREGASFETLDQGVRSGIRDARRVAIRDLVAWRTLWDEHVAGRVPPPPLPPVDFSREMVIAFFLGERPTGYTATIRDAQLAPDKLVVRVAVETPPPGSFPLQVLTQPYHLVRLPRCDPRWSSPWRRFSPRKAARTGRLSSPPDIPPGSV